MRVYSKIFAGIISAVLAGCGTADSELGESKDEEKGASDSLSLVNAAWDSCTAEYAAFTGGHGVVTTANEGAVLAASTDWYQACNALVLPQARSACLTSLAGIEANLQSTKAALLAAGGHGSYAKAKLAGAIARANNRLLGPGGILNLPAADRMLFITDFLLGKQGVSLLNSEMTSAQGTTTAALQGVSANAVIAAIGQAQMLDLQTKMGIAVEAAELVGDCIVDSLATLAVAAGINGENGFGPEELLLTNGEWSSGGSGTGYTSHPGFTIQTVSIDLDAASRKEQYGVVERYFEHKWSVPTGVHFTNALMSELIPGYEIVPANTPVVIQANYDDQPPSIEYNSSADEVQLNGAGLALSYLEDGQMSGTICNASLGDLLAGNKQGCVLPLNVTGSPAQIAAGERATYSFTIYAMGGNPFFDGTDNYFKYHYTISAPYEAPQDPCYVWDPSSQTYQEDITLPGCGPGGGGGA